MKLKVTVGMLSDKMKNYVYKTRIYLITIPADNIDLLYFGLVSTVGTYNFVILNYKVIE